VIETYQAPTEIALELWPALVPFINRAARYHPFLDQAGLRSLVARGFATIFVAVKGDAVVGFTAIEVVQYPGRRVANVIFAGGAYGFLETLVTELKGKMAAWGRAQGATAMSLTGRPGWLKLARKHGWTVQPQVFVTEELTDERRRRKPDPDQQDPE
jgi:hypothetical protein